MSGFFRIDGPFYKFGMIVYYLMVTNFLWVIFSTPLFTIGASTTALFYVMGKVVRDEDISTFKDYWKSFKMNFKQGTFIWLIMVAVFFVLYVNIRNVSLMGNMAKFIYPMQIAVLIELLIISVYVFPLLSRYNMTIRNIFKMSFFLGNKHIFSTITCVASLVAIYYLFSKVPGLFILIFVSSYALVSYYIINRVFQKYFPDKKKEELEE